MKNPVGPSSCVTPAGTSNELDDVQNKGEENTHTHTHSSLVVGKKTIMIEKDSLDNYHKLNFVSFLVNLLFVCLFFGVPALHED